MPEWLEDDDARLAAHRWPMAPNDLLPREQWLWWEQLWADAIALPGAYRIRLGHRLVGRRGAGRNARRAGGVG